ncbi:MAG TPA: DNA polymerase III subunit gamma/tau [Candidatus Saccharimonadia bacterium]
MSDQALYRKYRSATFTEVVGQEHVVKTLTSAITSGRISHAYLFTGPRGVGKTSVARLLARSLNCTGQAKPCNDCVNCRASINSSLDIVEIDAASNRSIDSVRDLREKIALAPTAGKYKIYIIDEVHMLTTEAFNALLKTLEEPPAHAVFVLATTEAHKVPETIISRTQRFNFRPIGTPDLVTHLSQIAKSENIQIDTDAIDIIATASRGGFRDAISLLDQLSAGKEPITADTVRALLGYTSAEEITALAGALAAADTTRAVQIVTRLFAAGHQPGQVVQQLTEYWRTVLLAAVSAGDTTDPDISQLAGQLPPSRIAAIIEKLLEVGRSHWPQLALETAVVQLCAPATPPVQPPATRAAKNDSPQPGGAGSDTDHHEDPDGVRRREEGLPAAAKSNPTATKGEPTVAASGSQLDPNLWPKVLVILKSKNNSLCALLQMYPIDFGSEEVTIKPRFNFHRDLFLKPLNRTSIEAAATKVYGRPVRVFARTEEATGKKRPPKTDPTSELVSSALEILGGEIVE